MSAVECELRRDLAGTSAALEAGRKVIETMVKRCDEAAVVFQGTEAGDKFRELRDYASKSLI